MEWTCPPGSRRAGGSEGALGGVTCQERRYLSREEALLAERRGVLLVERKGVSCRERRCLSREEAFLVKRGVACERRISPLRVSW